MKCYNGFRIKNCVNCNNSLFITPILYTFKRNEYEKMYECYLCKKIFLFSEKKGLIETLMSKDEYENQKKQMFCIQKIKK
jgi:hypothetical protein